MTRVRLTMMSSISVHYTFNVLFVDLEEYDLQFLNEHTCVFAASDFLLRHRQKSRQPTLCQTTPPSPATIRLVPHPRPADSQPHSSAANSASSGSSRTSTPRLGPKQVPEEQAEGDGTGRDGDESASAVQHRQNTSSSASSTTSSDLVLFLIHFLCLACTI